MKDQEENMCLEYESMEGYVAPVSWREGTGFQLAESLIHPDGRSIPLEK